MARPLSMVCAAALASLWLGLASSSIAGHGDLKIIVNRQNPAASVGRAFLRDVFMKRANRWSHGDAARPIDLPKGLSVRDRFTIDVLDKTPSQIRSYWVQRIFSGTDIPPPEAPSVAAAIAYVNANPGAVTYLPADADPGNAKVIPIQ